MLNPLLTGSFDPSNISDWFTAEGWPFGLMFILSILLISGITSFLGIKSHKKANQSKLDRSTMKLYVMKELQKKGIVQPVNKEDIKEVKKQWKRILRDHRMTKKSSKLEKRVNKEG